MTDLSLNEQLAALKALFVRFGAEHELLRINLKRWPLLVPGVSKLVQYGVDYDRRIVTFWCLAPKFRNTKKVKKTFEEVTRWVRMMMWDDTTVTFTVNDKPTYDSRVK